MNYFYRVNQYGLDLCLLFHLQYFFKEQIISAYNLSVAHAKCNVNHDFIAKCRFMLYSYIKRYANNI